MYLVILSLDWLEILFISHKVVTTCTHAYRDKAVFKPCLLTLI